VWGGVNAYLSNPDVLVTAETLVCPFCPDGHRLRRHGFYQRWALLPIPDPSPRIPVESLRAQGRDILEFLVETMSAAAHGSSPPSLLPA